MQLAGAKGDAEPVRDDLGADVLEQVGDPRAVHRGDGLSQTGDQVRRGHAPIPWDGGAHRELPARRLSHVRRAPGAGLARPRVVLPREGADDAPRRRAAGVPAGVRFATPPQLARRLLERALGAGVPAAWVTVYGGDRRRRVWLEQPPLVLAVNSDAPWFAVLDGPWGQPRADVLAPPLPPKPWRRLSAGQGAKGPRWYDGARRRRARRRRARRRRARRRRARRRRARRRLTAAERRWDHGLLGRRSDPTERAYDVVFAPAGTSLRPLARVAGERWRSEQSFELAKGEVGLDPYDGGMAGLAR